jgi:RHS repeat-associated protein
MQMPGRVFAGSEEYRYGFNGMEKDDEVKGEGNSLDFGARIYDPRLGRWLTVDKRFADYTAFSPYHFSLNSPIKLKDADGNVVVDEHGNEVLVFSDENEDGSIEVFFCLINGSAVSEEFMKNGGRVIISMMQIQTGQDLVNQVLESPDKTFIVVSPVDKTQLKTQFSQGKPKTTRVGKLGETKAIWRAGEVLKNPDGTLSQEKEFDSFEVTIYEGSINSFSKPSSTRPEYKKYRLDQEQKIGGIGTHEFTHTTGEDGEIIKAGGRIKLNDPIHDRAYDNGEQAEKEYGDKNGVK